MRLYAMKTVYLAGTGDRGELQYRIEQKEGRRPLRGSGDARRASVVEQSSGRISEMLKEPGWDSEKY